jgi:membrane-bound ClpP family serine protease
VRVNPWLLAAATAALAGSVFLVATQVVRARRAPLLTGAEHYLGQVAEVRTPLTPSGRVWFEGQYWTAVLSEGGSVPAGAAVRIVDRRGLTLVVEPVDQPALPGPAAA